MENMDIQMEIPYESTMKLVELNDDCLLKLFEYLDFLNCVALVKSSPRRFELLFRNVIIKRKALDFRVLKFRHINWMETFENILEDYGSELTHLKVDGYSYMPPCNRFLDEIIFNLINQYCGTGNLRSLTLEAMEISQDFINLSKGTLGKISSLTIQYCKIFEEDLGLLLANCKNLEVLKLNRHDVTFTAQSLNPLLSLNSSKLHTIIIEQCIRVIDRDTMINIFAQHPNLRCFDFVEDNLLGGPSNIPPPYDIICQMLPNIEKLTYKFDRVNNVSGISKLLNLRRLKNLSVSITPDQLPEFKSYLTFAGRLNILESLSIDGHESSDEFEGLIEAVSQCKSLRKLHIKDMPLISKNMVKFAENLPWLQRFKMTEARAEQCDLREEKLLKFIEKAKNLQKMKLHIGSGIRGNRHLAIDARFFSMICLHVARRPADQRRLTVAFSPLEAKYSIIGPYVKIICGFCLC